MKRVILESPYAGDVERNVAYLKRALRDSLLRGESPFASHAIYCGPLDDQILEERRRGIEAGFAFRQVVIACVVYDDYGISSGMAEGIRLSELMGHRIEHRKIGENP